MSYGDNFLFSADQLILKDKEKVCICGPNGCGKTTLLSILLGRKEAGSGEIRLQEKTAFGHLGQHVDFENEQATVLQTLLFRSDLSESDARTMLAGYGFRDVDVFKEVHVLSGGERARLYLCCLLLEQPDMLFLDEPTNHLDIESREILEQALRDYDGAILAVSHDRYFIERCCQRVYGFCNKQVNSYDSYADYREAESQKQSVFAPEKSTDEKVAPENHFIHDKEDVKADISEQNKQTFDQHLKTIEPNSSQSIESKNPAELRRLTAMKKKQLRETEQLIEKLEIDKNQMEAGFGLASDTPEDYEIYAKILEQLETLYADYIVLSDE